MNAYRKGRLLQSRETGCDGKARQKVSCERRERKRRGRSWGRRRRRMGDRRAQQAFTVSLDTGESRGVVTSAQRLLVLTIPLLIPALISSLVPSLSFGLQKKKKKHVSKHLQFILIIVIFFGLVYDSGHGRPPQPSTSTFPPW